MTKVLPVTPQEAVIKKQQELPDEVINAFNELIVENLHHGRANIKQCDAVSRICSAMNVDKEVVFAKRWLDVEGLFEKFGWGVVFDKPGWNESYEANFTFTIKR